MSDVFYKALQQFGETKNHLECGFIIPNGKMLKLQRINGTHSAQLKELSNTTLDEFFKYGAIRTINDANNCNVEIHLKPTNEQLNTLESFMDYYTKPTSYFSFDLIDNSRILSKVVDLSINKPSNVVNSINTFYSGKTPYFRESLERNPSVLVLEKDGKPSLIKQKVISGFVGLANLFKSNKIRIGSLPSSVNVTDITKAGYDRFLNDIMDDYVRWEKTRKELTWAERVMETRKSPRINTYKNVIFSVGSKTKLEDVFKFKHDNWMVFVANYYKTTDGGIIIAMVVVEPAETLINALKRLNYVVGDNTINLSDIIKNNNIPKEIQTLIEQNAKYYIYCNKAAEKWMIDRQGTGFRQYITYLTLQSYGKANRVYEPSKTQPVQIFNNLKKFWGVTRDYKLAGAILPDGTFIKYNVFTNESIVNIFNSDVSIDDAWTQLMNIGVIKIACQFTYSIYTAIDPSYIQYQWLHIILSKYKDGQGLINLKKDGEEHIKYYQSTNVIEVINEIKGFYNNNDNATELEKYFINIAKLLK